MQHTRRGRNAGPILAAILPLAFIWLGCDGRGGEVGTYVDAGSGGQDSGKSPAGDGDAQTGDGDDDGDGCGASADVKAVRKHTTVWLIIQADKLIADVNGPAFGYDVRGWTALREVLMGPQGLVPSFESVVEFGLVFHSGDNVSCPRLRTFEPALNAYAQLDALYPLDQDELWGGAGGAVTYKALEFVDPRLKHNGTSSQDLAPEILIIAKTTGESLCTPDASNVPDRPEQLVRAALQKVVARGVSAFVVRVPLLTDTSIAFEDELARIGGTGKAYTPMNTAGLRADFERILRDSISCEVTLNGEVTEGQECEGTVEVDGVEVPCDPKDGWRLKDPRTLELVGNACSDLRSKPTAQIRADFPCGVILF